MAGRPGKWDRFKPEVLRLFSEGMSVPQVRKQYPQVPPQRLYDWFNSFNIQSGINPESPKSGRKLSLPIDPESPIQKIRNKLLDIADDPEGKGVAVQALAQVLRSFEIEAKLSTMMPDDDAVSERPVSIRIVPGE